jgi:hypothetical protein
MIWACFQAAQAMNAPVRPVNELWRRRLTLRIMAPPTIKRASFEEHGGANTWAIVRRVPHQVKCGSSDVEHAHVIVSQGVKPKHIIYLHSS